MGKIQIYGPIGASIFGDSITASHVYARLDEMKEMEPVAVYINSGGGDVFDGIAIYNALRRHKGRVTVYIDGLAASAASVIAMAGDEVVMPENTMLMVHNPWTMTYGDADELRKTADILDKTRDAIVSAYRIKTGMDDEELRALLDGETWLSAQEAVDYGFANLVEVALDEEDIVKAFALHDFQSFATVPGTIAAIARRAHNDAAVAATKGEDMPQNTPVVPPVQASAPVDLDAVKAAAKAEYKARCESILALGTKVGLDRAKIDEIVASDVDASGARDLIIDAIAAQQQATAPRIAGVHSAVSVGMDEKEKFHVGALQAVSARAGLEDRDAKNALTGYTLAELARESLRVRGIDASGSASDVAMRVFQNASGITHSTADFTNITRDVAHKAMLRGWEEHPESFEAWTRAGNLSDFKTAHRVGLNGFEELEKVNENGEIKSGTMSDRGETIRLETFAKLFGISRQLIINDDLSTLVEAPRKMGRAARRTVGTAVYNLLINGQTMTETGETLFHAATHKNLKTTAFGATALTEIKAAMRTQKDPGSGGNLNISPSFLIVPAALEIAALQLMASQVKVGGTNGEPNPFAGMAQVIVEGRLDDASPTKFYAAADANIYDTIEVAYLNGIAAPFMDQQEGFTVDGVQYKVRLDFGVRALDFRGLFKSGT
jgi:ATP-dependent protease ClpP protease subunit